MTRETNGAQSPRFKPKGAVGHLKALEEQVAQQAAMAEQAEQAAQQAREAKAKAEQELLEAMVKAEEDARAAAEVQAQSVEDEAEALYASFKGRTKSKRSTRPLKPPHVAEKIMPRSYQRAKVVGGGTQLRSGAKQATVTFKPAMFKVLEMAATENEVSLSEMVRQLVDRGLRSQD